MDVGCEIGVDGLGRDVLLHGQALQSLLST